MEKYKEIERSIIKTYRKEIWSKFIKAVKNYQLIQGNDKIMVCISGGKDSFLVAKCIQELQRHGRVPFEAHYVVMDPGYNSYNRDFIEDNADLLNVPIKIFESNIFDVVSTVDKSPCYLCAKMRRGYLYSKAQELGCNKIALGHHFDDVIETILMGMLYGAQMQTMMPKLHSTYHEGMQLIRPLYYVKEADIIKWKEENDLHFLQCACRFTEHCTMCDNGGGGSKREEMKKLIKQLRSVYDKVDMNIYNSTKNVNLNTLISYVKDEDTAVMHQLITLEQCKHIVDWCHSRNLEFYLESNNGLFASENFEEKGNPVIKVYYQRKGKENASEQTVRTVFPEMIYGGELYRDDCNKVSFILNSYQDHLDSIKEFPDLKPGTWGGAGEIALFGDLGVKGIDKAHAIDDVLNLC